MWQPVPRDVQVFGGPGKQEMLRAAVAGSEIVAVGYRTSGSGDFDAAVWRSADPGRAWAVDPSPDLAGPGNQVARGVVAFGSEFVAVGSDLVRRQKDATVWTSSVGSTTWTRVDSSSLIGPGDQEMRRIAVVGNELVAVGFDTASGTSNVAVWTSPDGREWSRQPSVGALSGPGDQEARTLASSGDTLVIAGSTAVGQNRDAMVWVRRAGVWSSSSSASFGGPDDQHIDNVIVGGPGFIATGRDGSDGAIWISSDGLEWRSAAGDFGGPGTREVLAVAPSGAGYLAIGTETLGGATYGAVWTSPDGIRWSRAPGDQIPVLTDLGKQQDLVPYGEGLVAVGRAGRGGHADAEVWIASPA